MSEPQDKAFDKKAADEGEAPEVVAHDAEDDPWCAIYSCGSLAPD